MNGVEERIVEIPNGGSNNKNLLVVKEFNSSLYIVKWKNGGEVPTELQQKWTNPTLAIKDINRWQELKTAGEPKARAKKRA